MERISFADLLAVPPGATYYHSDQSGLDAQAPVPWEVRVGGSWAFSDDTVLALDLSVYGPLGSETDPIHAIGQTAPDTETGNPPQVGTFVVTDWWSELTANASIGFDTVLFDVVPFRVGAFTNLSAAPPVDGPSNALRPTSIDMFGVTGAVGIRSGGYDVAIGAALLMGSGTGYRMNDFADPAVSETYLPTDVSARTIYFFLSGAKRAAGRLARDVYDEVAD